MPPLTDHVEKHFSSSLVVRDVVIGMSDGLTVPFALAAGLSGAVDQGHIIVTAGLAEIAAGAIAMGLGGYLAARTDAEHFFAERDREERETIEIPEVEQEECKEIFRSYGLPEAQVTQVVDAISSDRKRWVDFMMKFELGIERPNPKRARNSAFTIAISYILGGFIPLSPYMLTEHIPTAFQASIIATLLSLMIFGYVKGRFTVARPMRSAWQTLLVGSFAAATAYTIGKFLA